MAISLAEAWAIFATTTEPLATKIIAVTEAIGRVLPTPLIAQRAHPHTDIAAMDGYGFAATPVPCALELVGTAAAGEPYNGTVQAEQCVRILTGADIPAGVTTVAMQEDCAVKENRVRVPASPAREFIRCQGSDFTLGTEICASKRALSSRDIAVALAAGWANIIVHRAPRLRLLATGSELHKPGSTVGTINSNIHALRALLLSHGAKILSANHCPDDARQLKISINDAQDSDLLLITGGVSVGNKDLVRPCLEALGAEILFHGVLMKPGKPSLFARLKCSLVLGLPGNPVSAQVCGQLLALPLLRALSGIQTLAPTFVTAITTTVIPAGGMRENYLRGFCIIDDDSVLRVRPMPNQDSAALHSLAGANCLIRVPIGAPAAPKGTKVAVTTL
ncbi:MAG: molybdopterin molybdotransferase MoeA [Alphaproteobacteria bacterium]|nr:molybdopterin molybdotransferase MoeA [Alphaproteobacteria bacterium]